MIPRILRLWFLLTIAGIAIYVALFAFGTLDSPLTSKLLPSNGIWGVVLGALAVSILLAIDEQSNRSDEKVDKITFAGLAYVLLVKRRALLTLLILSIATMGLVIYYISKSIGVTFEAEGSTFSVKLPGQTVYYFPIHSQQSWQNTEIRLKKEQPFRYSITGYVSPGYLQDIDIRSRDLREYKLKGEPYRSPELAWPFKGPEGFSSEWYTLLAEKDKIKCNENYGSDEEAKNKCYRAITRHYNEDTGLTVQGVAHNRVIGIIINESAPAPRSAADGNPGYVYKNGESSLILFDGRNPTELKRAKGNADGILWVVINDSDAYRWDNAGLFFLKLVID